MEEMILWSHNDEQGIADSIVLEIEILQMSYDVVGDLLHPSHMIPDRFLWILEL